RDLCRQARALRREIRDGRGTGFASLMLGAILTAMAARGRTPGSLADGPEAEALLDEAERVPDEGRALAEGPEMEPLAALLRTHLGTVDLARGEVERAYERIAPVLRGLEEGRFVGSINGLNCYRILAAKGDPRAGPMLRDNFDRLMKHAAPFADP